jgi:DNA modification methylase
MKIETLAIKDLTLDPQNARQHDPKNLKAIEGSLAQFGQRKPIVITEANVIVAGNGTVTAAKNLGWEKIEAVRVPADWSKDQVKAFALADNRTAELATWAPEVLAAQLIELEDAGFEIADFGFDKVEPEIDPDSLDEDEIPEPPAEPVTKLGDLWQLGRHRLLCGDSTDIGTVQRLMDGSQADMVFTDPPYGVEYQSNFRTKSPKFDVLKNDDVILDIEPVISQFNKGFIFVWTSWKVMTYWIERLSELGYPSNIIIWDKGGGYIGDLEKTFGTDYELALVWHNGNKLTGKRIGSVWSVNKDSGGDYAHPTQKPIELAVTAIQSTTTIGQKVLDLFGGSGSTLIAAEKTNRDCLMMELDPKYCDVIIKRWENLTGQKAQLVNATR